LKTKTFASAFALMAAGTLMAGAAQARDQIRVVGSSTVYPFTRQDRRREDAGC
jgi:phosphate transport system substrate-binding protein